MHIHDTNMKTYLGMLLLLLIATSCATKKQIHYFQDAENLNDTAAVEAFRPRIEENDILHISLSSYNLEALRPFIRQTGLETNIANTNPGLVGYLVNSAGNINYPVLGDIYVVGKTRREVEEILKEQLSAFITDVVVDVRIMNFKVTVIGEVTNPGVYTVNDERVTIPQALALAGDLTRDGKRDNIMIIREEEGKQMVTRVDMTQTALFNSEFFFLKQNDIVYVEPSLVGVKKSGFIPDIPALLSLTTVILSTVILLTN